MPHNRDHSSQSSTPVSIIIPVWNGMADLPACLATLTQQCGIKFEIIVVDNASTDGAADFITRDYPQIRLLQNSLNRGFVRACNAGLRMARGEILVLLNQDTEVYPNWLIALIAPLLADATIGMTGSKALFIDGTIQHAGGYIDDRGVGHSHAYHMPSKYADKPRSVHYVSGAALALTRRTYERIGAFDEGFAPAYYEDTDWCRRARRAGLSIRYVPDSVLLHKERSVMLSNPRQSSEQTADQKHRVLATLHRNRLRYVLKHWSITDIIQRFVPAEQAWFHSLGWQGEALAVAAQDAYLHHLLHMSEVLDARRAAIPTTTQDAEMLSALLLQLRLNYPLAPAALTNSGALDAGDGTISGATSPDRMVGRGATKLVKRMQERLRQRWPQFSLAAITWPLARMGAQLTHRQLLADVLLEYIRQNNREISQLAHEVESLRLRLDQQLAPKHEGGTDTLDARDRR